MTSHNKFSCSSHWGTFPNATLSFTSMYLIRRPSSGQRCSLLRAHGLTLILTLSLLWWLTILRSHANSKFVSLTRKTCNKRSAHLRPLCIKLWAQKLMGLRVSWVVGQRKSSSKELHTTNLHKWSSSSNLNLLITCLVGRLLWLSLLTTLAPIWIPISLEVSTGTVVLRSISTNKRFRRLASFLNPMITTRSSQYMDSVLNLNSWKLIKSVTASHWLVVLRTAMLKVFRASCKSMTRH